MAYGTAEVWGSVQTDHAGIQSGVVRVRSTSRGVTIDMIDKGVVLDHDQAKMLAAFLVALSRPEGTES